MRRKTAFVTAGLAVALLILAAAGLGEAGGPASLKLSGDVVDHGLAAGGALVLLQALPNQAAQEAATPGVAQSLFPVAAVRAKGNGSYNLSVDLSQIPAAYINADGTVNLQLMAVRGGYLAATNFPEAASSPVAAPPAASVLDLASGAYSTAALAADSVQVGTAQVTAAASQNATPYVCSGGYWGGPEGPYQTKLVAATAGANVYATVTYSYGGSSSTTMGVAFDGSGGWAGDGTISNGTSSQYGFQTGYQQDKSDWGLWRYHSWYGSCGGRWDYPLDYVGRGQTVSIAQPSYGYCSGWYYAGDSWTRDASSFATWSDGVNFPYLTLSAQSGASTTESLSFYFGANGHICGDSSLREGAPHIEAHQG